MNFDNKNDSASDNDCKYHVSDSRVDSLSTSTIPDVPDANTEEALIRFRRWRNRHSVFFHLVNRVDKCKKLLQYLLDFEQNLSTFMLTYLVIEERFLFRAISTSWARSNWFTSDRFSCAVYCDRKNNSTRRVNQFNPLLVYLGNC